MTLDTVNAKRYAEILCFHADTIRARSEDTSIPWATMVRLIKMEERHIESVLRNYAGKVGIKLDALLLSFYSEQVMRCDSEEGVEKVLDRIVFIDNLSKLA